jgi:hypothetical protein
MILCEFLATFWKLYYAIRVLLVVEYVKLEKFDYFCQVEEEIVFRYMASGPLIWSSYQNGEIYWEHMINWNDKLGQSKNKKKILNIFWFSYNHFVSRLLHFCHHY